MPVASLWTIVVSLALLAFSLTLKVAELKRTIKRIDQESDLLRTEPDTVKKQKYESESISPARDSQPEIKKTGRTVDFTGVFMR